MISEVKPIAKSHKTITMKKILYSSINNILPKQSNVYFIKYSLNWNGYLPL